MLFTNLCALVVKVRVIMVKERILLKDIIEDYYKPDFLKRGFSIDLNNKDYCNVGSSWKLSDKIGKGSYWIYGQKNLFDIKIHNFYFHKDTMLEFNHPKSLSITQYESISGEELSPYRRLTAGYVKSFIGGKKSYKILIHKNIPIRSIGIEIMPAYYEDYLKNQYPNEYTNPIEAFLEIDQTMNFPEMSRLLLQLKNYRGEGISANLFFEGKVAEAVSLIVERKKSINGMPYTKLPKSDIDQIETVTAYLNDHYANNISLKRIATIACMGTTKLQTTFKKYHGCTITAYIQQRRMSQAEYLLSATDFSIGQIAQIVGYLNASRFAELFHKSTGLLPGEYRKMTQQ